MHAAKNLHLRHRAQSAFTGARARGEIEKPDTCINCGSHPKSRSLHGHHEDYAKPFEVIWLCVKCHSRVHAADDSLLPDGSIKPIKEAMLSMRLSEDQYRRLTDFAWSKGQLLSAWAREVLLAAAKEGA